MSDDLRSLPPELLERFMSFLRDVDGQIEVIDGPGFVGFVMEHYNEYPVLLNMIKLNEEALTEHYERTGEVPPGVKLIKKTTREGENVTKLEIIHGPRAAESNE